MKTLLTENGKRKIQDELHYLQTVEKMRAIPNFGINSSNPSNL